MPEDDRKRALAHYKQAAKYKRRKMKHKYMAHLLRGDQYMRASALAFGVPLVNPNMQEHGFDDAPNKPMVYSYGPSSVVLAFDMSDDKTLDTEGEKAVDQWNWKQGKDYEMSAVDLVCHRELTTRRPIKSDYSSDGNYHVAEYKSTYPSKNFFMFRSEHTRTFLACDVDGLRKKMATATTTTNTTDTTTKTKLGAKDADNLIMTYECARLALEDNVFLISVEDWRDGALLVKSDDGEKWKSANLCEKFAYYDFALRKRNREDRPRTYVSRDTKGEITIPSAYFTGMSDTYAHITMSTDKSGAVFCNGREMRSTSMVADDDSTLMSEIRARFILGVLAGDDMHTKKIQMEKELGAEFIVRDDSAPIKRTQAECQRKARASTVLWPILKNKVACTYAEASKELKEEVDRLRNVNSPEYKLTKLAKEVYPIGYHVKAATDTAYDIYGKMVKAAGSALGATPH